MSLERNRLWGFPFSEENLAKAMGYRRFYACNDHCLVIASEEPDGAVEIREELARFLSAEDWAWIFQQSADIRREQEDMHREEIEKAQEAFWKRFVQNLEVRKAEMNS